ncbi:hypothetical protein GCM10017717_23010 [Deinococcus persicinus]
MFVTNLNVRFNDCDSLGHVNNSVYFTYFEEARKGLFQIFNEFEDKIVEPYCCID